MTLTIGINVIKLFYSSLTVGTNKFEYLFFVKIAFAGQSLYRDRLDILDINKK
jgi:hypothetical protein